MAKAFIDEHILEMIYEEVSEPFRKILIDYIEAQIYYGSDINEYCAKFLPHVMTVNNIDMVIHKKSTGRIFVAEFKHSSETVDDNNQMLCLKKLSSLGVPVYMLTVDMPKNIDERNQLLKSGEKRYKILDIFTSKSSFASLGELDRALVMGGF